MDPIQTEQPVRRERGGRMSNYQPLWEQIKAANQPFLQLTFDRIEAIVQHPLNHSFLNAKKELLDYGYRVHKISCKEQTVWFEKLDRKDTLVLYVHGMGGTADEAEHYRPLFLTCDVLGVDYRSKTPWEAAKEFSELFDTVSDQTPSVLLIANSIGAYFFHLHTDKKAVHESLLHIPDRGYGTTDHRQAAQAQHHRTTPV